MTSMLRSVKETLDKLSILRDVDEGTRRKKMPKYIFIVGQEIDKYVCIAKDLKSGIDSSYFAHSL